MRPGRACHDEVQGPVREGAGRLRGGARRHRPSGRLVWTAERLHRVRAPFGSFAVAEFLRFLGSCRLGVVRIPDPILNSGGEGYLGRRDFILKSTQKLARFCECLGAPLRVPRRAFANNANL